MKTYTECTDEELVAMLKSGQRDVGEFLAEKYKYLVRKKARALYLVGGEKEDLIQEGMLGLFRAMQDFNPKREASFYTFANTCIDRQLCSAITSSNRKKHQPLNSYVSLSAEEWEGEIRQLTQQNPEAILIDAENERTVREQITAALSPLENQVLEFYLEGCDYVKIAETLERSPKSIDNALQRIRMKIKKCVLGER